MNNDETVFIVDSDIESREKVGQVVQGMNLRHEAYTSASGFLERVDPQRPGCAILEIRISDANGLQLQQQLAQQPHSVPVIFHSTHASVPVVVRAIQQGAVNFLVKPADEQELWDAIQKALQLDRELRVAIDDRAKFQTLLEKLTHKEHEVLEILAQGKSTRAIARELNVSIRTVEFRRARMLEKLGFQSQMQLLRFAFRAMNRDDAPKAYNVRTSLGTPHSMRRLVGEL